MNKLLLCILMLLTMIASTSHAAYLQLPKTGQTTIQAAGDDGAIQSGKAWPTPRFVDNHNGTVGDNLTGLVWAADANLFSARFSGGEMSWQQSLDEIKRLNTEAYLGYSDWRLPNLNELASLVNQGETIQNTWLNRNGLNNITPGTYWSSSSFSRDASHVWTVNMDVGSIGVILKSTNAHTSIVRGVSNLLPVTGQTVCSDTGGVVLKCSGTGQDGELQTGVTWPVVRFSDNGDGTILDNLTGLVWPQNANSSLDTQLPRASSGSTLWNDALNFITNLNSKTYLGHSDWRLPNRNELISLVNYSESTPGVQLNKVGVGGIQERYWSSGTSATNPSDAWSVTINGEVIALNKYDFQLGSYIWPVRDGIAVQPVSTLLNSVQTKTVASQTVMAAAVALSVSTSTLPAGTIGITYSQTLAATGGTTPYTWTKKSGTMPAGLTLSSAGVISGKPTTAGTSTFTVQVKDKAAKTATKTLSIVVSATPATPPSITTTTLADGIVSVTYSQTLAATGGKTPYTWSKTAGSLPTGLALSTAGVISGKPTIAGASSFTVQVKDANNAIATKALSITVAPQLSITTTGLPEGSVGSAYNQTFAANGGKAPYTWSITSGTLPTGLALTASSGVISGSPSITGWSNFTIQVIDANNSVASAPMSLYINLPLNITTTALSGDYVGFTYNQTITAVGGTSPYSWTIVGGALPAGLVLNSVSGTISGTPTLAETRNFTIQVKDAANAVVTAPLTIVITTFGSISGIVTDQATGVPLAGVAVTLKLDYTNKNPNDRLYSCNNIPITSADYEMIATNDGNKYPCENNSSNNTMYFKMRNPFGVADSFTVNWNGIGTLSSYTTEYLAQSFKPTKSGSLDKVSFHLSDNVSSYTSGSVRVLLKSRLGGDRGSYLAISNAVSLSNYTSGAPVWIDFNFPVPVQITAGQEYYLEINGTFFEWYGGALLYDLFWSGSIPYVDGTAFKKNGGIWSQQAGSLAFRTYVDTVVDIDASPSTAFFYMDGGNTVQLSSGIYNPASGSWTGVLSINKNFPDSDGYYKYNGDDVTAIATVTDNVAGYYDQNGWLQVKVTSLENVWYTNLTTDFFDITFSRILTTTTDASGAYSFAGLPDGNYTITFEKAAYTSGNLQGALIPGENRTESSVQLSRMPPAAIQGQITSGSLPVSGALITLSDILGNHQTTSDSQGNYSISGVAPGAYTISVEPPPQLQTTTLSGTLASGQSGIMNVTLTPQPVTVTITSPTAGSLVYNNPVTITGSAVNADSVTIIMNSFNSTVGISYPAMITNGTYSATVPIEDGKTWIQVGASNKYGASDGKSITVTRAPFTIKNLGDTGNVAVMEVTGDFNAKNSDGTVNDAPRQEITKEYIRTHDDSFDYIVYLSTFDYAMPEAGALGYYTEVKNDTQGINRTMLNNSSQYGSGGMLQGTIDLGNVTALAQNPDKLDEFVTTLNHELGHRYTAYVRYKNPDGTLNTSLLGKDNAHWSYLLDTKGSLMYGNSWKDNNDGTFTATAAGNSFSPLDLYLMGMIPKEHVPPMLLIDNPGIDKTKLPKLGDVITGTAKTVTIDDIIAAEGERIPDYTTSQKQFKVGFVLASRSGDNTTQAAAVIETLRKAWAGRFAELTQGKASVANIPASLEVAVTTPVDGATITGPDVNISGTVINSSGAETGVTVNGQPATVSGNRYIANHVPLQTGSNTLTITATDANGLTTTATRTVTAQAGNYLRISSNIDSGTGPLEVSLRIDGSFVVTAPTVNVTGPGGAATLTAVSATEYTAKFISEGTYTVTATATGPDGQTYTDSTTITVIPRYQLETLLKAKWDGMKAKIAAGDTAGAGSYFDVATRGRFQAIFNDPTRNIMPRLNKISEIEIYTISNNAAQGGAIRQERNGIFAYPINFSRDNNGVWRILGF